MNTQLLHDATFYILYGCIALALFIAIERGLTERARVGRRQAAVGCPAFCR